MSLSRPRADIARFTAVIAQDKNALDFAAGASVPKELLRDGSLGEAIISNLPTGVPSEVLQRWPDILAAEHLLKRQTRTSAPRAHVSIRASR